MDAKIAPTLKKMTLPVTGMSCASCAGSVERTLQAETGVVSAAVNYANASVLLEFDPKVTQVERLPLLRRVMKFTTPATASAP